MANRPPGRSSAVELPDQWYVACLASELGRRPLARTVLGTPLCLFRDGAGRVGAMVDRCPHRNVPLSLGRLRDGLLECGYHGWRFDGEGTPDAAFHVLRGTLIFVYEVSGTVGEVGMPEVVESTPAGVTVRYDVRWQ